MKKMMMLLAATMLLLGLNGQAMAYFSQGDLIQVAYSGTTEIATDEGSMATLLAGGSTLNFSSPLANANVAYFAYNSTIGGSAGTSWISGNNGGQSAIGGSANAFATAYGAVTTLYYQSSTPFGSAAQASVATTNASSYVSQMDGDGPGNFAGFLNDNSGETTLVANGPVQQTLYSYTGSRGTLTGSPVVTINTGNVAATPVPPSILLMGSGLLGLAGIGRKRSV
jgi:hypothetical protein